MIHHPIRSRRRDERPGYVLVVVLIVVVVLSLAAYKFSEVMTSEYRAAVRTSDAAQAKAAAASGVHYAAAMLADPNAFNGDLGGNPCAAEAFGRSVAVRDGDTSPKQPRFALVAAVNLGDGSYEQRYGAVIDEAGKLNINTLIQLDSSGQKLYDALMKLPNMTADVADAIVDWVDPDDDQRPTGAESAYYQGLPQGYKAKNGPLNSLDELLLVKGVTPQLLFGTDRNRNGVADDDPGGSAAFDRGWAEYLTVYGRELNVDSAGVLRENVNESEDLPGLYQRLTSRVGPELADFILAYKMFSVSSGTNSQQTVAVAGPAELNAAVTAALGASPANKRRIKSLFDLTTATVTLPKPPGAPNNAPAVVVPSPLNDPAKAAALLGTLLDMTTTTTNVELTPRINLNTAPREVLVAVPGIAEEDVDALLAVRDAQNPTDPATLTGAWVVTTKSMTPANYKKIEKYVTGRTMVYRVQALGYFAEGGPVARVEAVIDTNQGAPRVLYFRDLIDLDSPRGFEPPR
jgi:type II secretory pathway component PulK